MPEDEQLRALGRVKQTSDVDSMRYIELGGLAVKALWFIGAIIVFIAVWVARLEWNMRANTSNIDKMWEKVFPHEPIKDQ